MNMLRVGTLFSGIETPISALQLFGIKHQHVFSCEIDKWCRKVIEAKFKPVKLYDDISGVDIQSMPECDVVVAGVPCQSFSHMGHRLGLKDVRGNLFLKLAEYLEYKNPRIFLMENVSHLLKHDGGKTFGIMQGIFSKLGYETRHEILASDNYGIPQMRKRIYIVGYKKDDPDLVAFKFPERKSLRCSLDSILGGKADRRIAFTLRVGGRGSPYGERHNWEFYKVDGKVMRIGVREACLLQGLPGNFYDGLGVPEIQAMKQLGNAMTVDVVGAVLAGLSFDGGTVKEVFGGKSAYNASRR